MGLEDQLNEAMAYAACTGSFHRMNLVERAAHVCVYGLGRYFEDAFIAQDVRERFRVDMLCDSDYGKVRSVVARSEYAGLQGISFEELQHVRDVYVIVMLGNPTEALEQIGGGYRR